MTERRPTSRQRGYTAAWEKARAAYLASHPWCAMCAKIGMQTPATVVDHITPHRGDQRLFWDQSNWQPLCQPHHDRVKQRQEARGQVMGCDAAGRPLAPNHPWNRTQS